MTGAYSREQRAGLAEALARGERPVCPACGGDLSRSEVERPAAVAYVRRRVLLVCVACGRSAAVDVLREVGPP